MLERHENRPPFIPMRILGLETQIYMLAQCYEIGFFGIFNKTLQPQKFTKIFFVGPIFLLQVSPFKGRQPRFFIIDPLITIAY